VTTGEAQDDKAAAAAARAHEKLERVARVYDAEIWPAYAQRFGAMLLDAVPPRPAARVVEVGCATGALTLELLRRWGEDTHVVALDEAAFVAHAQPRLAPSGDHVQLRTSAAAPLPLPDAIADVALSNLAVAAFDDPPRAVRELARVVVPGGRVALTAPLRGTWSEFLDIFRDVLLENGPAEGAAALERHVAETPDGAAAVAWLEAAGLVDVQIAVERWEILFRSAREFFFAPLIELGPLSRWKRIAGRGEDMQDAFFFTKEAIDTYFSGSVFPATVVGAVVTGRKPATTSNR
jgi:ubiquinone/menaquinone biosynthesis C-methylase UbiE